MCLRCGRPGGLVCLSPGPESAQERLEEPVRGHQGGRYRIGVRPGRFQARARLQHSVAYADQVLAVGAAPGLIDQAAIGLVGQDAAPPVWCVELLRPVGSLNELQDLFVARRCSVGRITHTWPAGSLTRRGEPPGSQSVEEASQPDHVNADFPSNRRRRQKRLPPEPGTRRVPHRKRQRPRRCPAADGPPSLRGARASELRLHPDLRDIGQVGTWPAGRVAVKGGRFRGGG